MRRPVSCSTCRARATLAPRSLPHLPLVRQQRVKEGKADDAKDILERILADIDPATFDEVRRTPVHSH